MAKALRETMWSRCPRLVKESASMSAGFKEKWSGMADMWSFMYDSCRLSVGDGVAEELGKRNHQPLFWRVRELYPLV